MELVDRIIPKSLPDQGTIGIFSPSEPLTPSRNTRLNSNIRRLEQLGYRVKFAPNYSIINENTAGTVAERLADIHALLSDPSVDLLLASWGGKSSSQLLDGLDYELIKNARKPICGFSDCAAFLNAISARTGLVTYYGPNVAGKLDESEYSDFKSLQNDPSLWGSLIEAKDVSWTINSGSAIGNLYGGNLSTFCGSIIGSEFQPNLEGAILFFESGEKTSQELNMLLTSIKKAGIFNSIAGLLLGDMPIKNQPSWGQKNLRFIITAFTSSCSFPVIHAPIFGHSKLANPIFPIGMKVQIDSTAMSFSVQD